MQLHRARKDFEAAGLKLVFIGQATPRHAAHFRQRMEFDAPVLADEKRQTYKLIGAKHGNVNQLIGPKVVAKGVLTARKYGVSQGRTIGSPSQLGGAMVILPGGEVAHKHLAKDASDNFSPEDLLAAVR